MNVSRTLTKEQVAKQLNAFPRTVAKWAKSGCPHARRGNGPKAPYLFNLVEVETWLRSTGRTGKPGRPSIFTPKNQDMGRATQLLAEERALLTRLEREQKAGRLHDAVECQRRQLAKIHAVKTALLGLARAASSELEMRPAAEIEQLLDVRIRAVLTEFAEEKGAG